MKLNASDLLGEMFFLRPWQPPKRFALNKKRYGFIYFISFILNTGQKRYPGESECYRTEAGAPLERSGALPKGTGVSCQNQRFCREAAQKECYPREAVFLRRSAPLAVNTGQFFGRS
jgi:hypothetical protein